MITALTHDGRGQTVLVLGLTTANVAALADKPIAIDATPVGLEATIVIVQGDDLKSLMARLVELGVADRSLLDQEPPTPTEAKLWRPGVAPRRSDNAE